MSDSYYIIGTDTGGTFTDITVLSESGKVYVNKAASTPKDFSQGVIDAIAKVAEDMELTSEELLSRTIIFKHGSTVATNAFITREGAKVGLITTRGFEDTTLIMRAIGRVAGLSEEEIKHQATCIKPVPIVPRELIRGVTERIDFQGEVVISLNIEETRAVLRSLVEDEGVEGIAVNLLFGYVNPIHEQQIDRLFREMYPDSGISLTCAHEISRTIREYARSNTVILNEFLHKTVKGYINNLERKLRALKLQGPLLVMQANGGAVLPEEVIPIGTVNSGPCGGMIASHHMAGLLGHPNVITTDMGGTSFDVGIMVDHQWRTMLDPVVERFHISWPMLDITAIGAGGGTIARVDPVTAQLLVGPKSAGADPGPVCYDHGGENITITDANLILGYLDPEYYLGGRMQLNKAKAEEHMREKIAKPLGISVVEAAAGIYQIINSHMSDLIRRKVVTTGHIPEEFVIYSFGGAGPVHAAAYGADLGVQGIYVFPTSAVFSSFGVAAADIVVSHPQTFRLKFPCNSQTLNEILADVEEKLSQSVQRQGVPKEAIQFRRLLYMRYVKQLSDIEVPVPGGEYNKADIERIMREFETRYEEIYGAGTGYRQAGIEMVSFTVEAVGPMVKPRLTETVAAGGTNSAAALKGERPVFFPDEHEFIPTRIYDYRRLLPGNEITGPSIIETPITTVVIPPGARAVIQPLLTIAITPSKGGDRK